MTAETMVAPTTESLDDILPLLAERSERSDGNDEFVSDSVEALAARGVLELMVPTALGGGGASHAEVCDLLRRIARACPSTALCLAMHQHLVAAAVWRWRRDRATEALLRRVASERILLVSTGANSRKSPAGAAALGSCRFGAR